MKRESGELPDPTPLGLAMCQIQADKGLVSCQTHHPWTWHRVEPK